MSQKRQSDEDSARSDGKRQKGTAAFRGLVMNVIMANKIQKVLSQLEPLLRRIVKEEIERALATHFISFKRQCGSQVYPSSSGCLHLQFQTSLSHPVFTGAKLEGDSGALVVVLLDPLTGYVVTSGPESSLVVEIVVLDGDFEGDNEGNWTFEDFQNNTVKGREGKRSLLAGDTSVILDGGTGSVNEILFTDNSSWTRSRKFRLGARVENGHFNGIRIKEAKTESFVVKDHRGELYKKHYPPSLADEIWRLEKIGKDGAFHKRLSKENVKTVQDFLMLLSVDAPRLRNILGSGMSNKMWEVTVEHARKCVHTTKMYAYYDNDSQQSGVIYNEIGELKGLVSEQQYIPVSKLSDIQKAGALELLKVAYERRHHAHPYAVEDGLSSSLSPILNGSSLRPSFFDECSSSQRADLFGSLSGILSPDLLSSVSMECLGALNDYRDTQSSSSLLHHDAYKQVSPVFDDYFTFDPCIQPDSLREESPCEVRTEIAVPIKPRGKGSGKKLKKSSSFDVLAARPVTIGWGALLSVLSWTFSIKRIVASKRKEQT